MATAYTSLLGLALPVTGELSGTWGDTVNNSITSLLDTAVAGTTTLSTDGDVTLTTTTGASNQARQAILLCSGARTAARNITAPAQSKIYTVINATTGGYAVVIRGAGPTTGISVPAGQTAQVAWNGSDFVDASNYTNGNLRVNGTLTVTGAGSIQGLTVGRGAGAVSTNTAVGASALAANSTGIAVTAIGYQAANASTAGYVTAVGANALVANTTGVYNTAVGTTEATNGLAVMRYNTSGSYNTAFGGGALAFNSTASNNTAVGYQAGYANTTGAQNTFIGRVAGYTGTTGASNTFIGNGNGYYTTTGSENTAIGSDTFQNNTTGVYNTSLGRSALFSSITANNNTAVGYQSMYSATGSDNTAIGWRSGYNITTGVGNICLGYNSNLNNAADNYEFVCGVNATGKGGNSGYFAMGGMYQGNNSASWNTTSDQRLKKNIVDFKVGLEKIAAIKVRNFEYRLAEEIEGLAPSNAIAISGVQLGVIAQELQQVLPECVTQESSGVLSVNPDRLTWYLINAIQELKAEIDTLKGQA